MTELINALFELLSASDYAQYGSVIIFTSYVLSHVVQYLPVSVTEKIPNIVMTILNLIAAKHGSEEAAKTTLAGNKVEGGVDG